MTLSAILLDSYRRLGFSASPEGEVTTRLSGFADEAQKEIIREPGCEQLLRVQLTFATVADQAEYALGMGLASISQVRDIDHEQPLRAMSEAEYRAKYPDPSRSGGFPLYYVPLALAPVALRTSDASQVFIKSDSALDVQTAYWTVLTSSGEVRTGSTTLTGVTALTLSSSITTIVQVLDIYLSQAANGTVTLHEDSGAGTEIARITIDQSKVTRKQLALFPTPSDVRTMTVEGERDVTDLIQPNDEPILPPRFHPMIGIGIRKREFALRGNSDRWMMEDRDWQAWRGDLRRFLDPTQGIVVPGGRRVGWSQLGPTFPAEWYR